jgi:hypothetical protein
MDVRVLYFMLIRTGSRLAVTLLPKMSAAAALRLKSLLNVPATG